MNSSSKTTTGSPTMSIDTPNFKNQLYVSAIAAVSANWVIGKDNRIPWIGKIPGEQLLFKRFTAGKAVIMGRNTWDSLPAKVKPLPGRLNIVLTSRPEERRGCYEIESLESALRFCLDHPRYNEAVLIGGQRVYSEGLKYCQEIHLTQLDAIFPGDAFFPRINFDDWIMDQEERYPISKTNFIDYTVRLLVRYSGYERY